VTHESLSTVSVPAFAKINLSLEVVGRRPDGYHELRTVFQTVSLADTLHFSRLETSDIRLECDRLELATDERNLVVRAARALQAAAGVTRGAAIRLEKRIPMEAGLGGGSSDAGVTLLALRRLWNATVPDETLLGIAASLGADVPFFLYGGTALGTGRGDIIEPLPDVEVPVLLLVNPKVAVPTAPVFRSLNMPLTSPEPSRIFTAFPPEGDARTVLVNDLEVPVFRDFPVVGRVREMLIEAGATVARMSGSGSTVFGFFENAAAGATAENALAEHGWRVWSCRSVSRAEYAERVGHL
jgi:4-diphosphocytidyl-2-C-methyl-D-erythritol kinase